MPFTQKPLSLLIISALYIIQGASGIIEFIANLDSLSAGYLQLGIGLLKFFTGMGLWRCRPRWHAFAVVITTLGIFLLPLGALILILMLFVIGFDHSFNQTVGPHILLSLAAMVPAWLFLLWQQSVLNRPDVLGLYRR